MSRPERPGELQDVTVDAISLVTKAANGERFKVFKSDKGAEPEPSTKADERTMTDEHSSTVPEDVQKNERGLLDSMRAVFKALVGIDGADVRKGDVADIYAAQEKGRKLNDAIEALYKGLGRSRWGDGDDGAETSLAAIRKALSDFQKIAEDILLGTDEDVKKAVAEVGVEKSGRKISGPRLARLKEMYAILGHLIEETDQEGDVEEVNKEDITKVVKESLDEALKPISERLDKLEKAEEEAAPAAEPQDGAKDTGTDAGTPDVGEVVKAALEEALAPFTARLEKVEKARGFSNRVPEEAVQKDDDGFWDGLF